MKIKIFFLIFYSLFFINNNVYSEIKIAYIDMEFIFNNSIVGKKLTEKLNKISKTDEKFFKQKEKELQEKELKIISQKNIVERSELENMLSQLRNEANDYRNTKNKKIKDLNEKKIKASELLFESIRPILVEYSNKNSISIFLQKKNIVIGKTELNKTNDILKIVDEKITNINLN